VTQLLLKLLFDGLFSILEFFIGLFPTISLPDSVATDIPYFTDVMGYFGTVVSFPLVLSCIAAIVTVQNFSLFTRVLKFVLNKFMLG